MQRQSTIGRVSGTYDKLLRLIAYSGNCSYRVTKYNGRSGPYNSRIIEAAEDDGFVVRVPKEHRACASYRMTKYGYQYLAEQIMKNVEIRSDEIQVYFRSSKPQKGNNPEYRRNLSMSQIASLFQNIGAALYPDEDGFYLFWEDCKRSGICIKPKGYCFLRADLIRDRNAEIIDANATMLTRSHGVLITPKYNMLVYFFDNRQLRISRAAEDRYYETCEQQLTCTGNPLYALYIFSNEAIMMEFVSKAAAQIGYLNPYNCRCDRLFVYLLTHTKSDPIALTGLLQAIDRRIEQEKKAKEVQEAIGNLPPVPYHDMTALDIAYLNRLNTHYAESKHPVKIQTLSAYVELVDRFCREQIGSKLCVTVPDFFEDFEG